MNSGLPPAISVPFLQAAAALEVPSDRDIFGAEPLELERTSRRQ